MIETTGYVLCGGRSERMMNSPSTVAMENMYFADHIAKELYKEVVQRFLIGKECFLYHCTTPTYKTLLKSIIPYREY